MKLKNWPVIALCAAMTCACTIGKRAPMPDADFRSRYFAGVDESSLVLQRSSQSSIGGFAELAVVSVPSGNLSELLKRAGYELVPAEELEISIFWGHADNAAGKSGRPSWFDLAGQRGPLLYATTRKGTSEVSVLASPKENKALFVVVGR